MNVTISQFNMCVYTYKHSLKHLIIIILKGFIIVRIPLKQTYQTILQFCTFKLYGIYTFGPLETTIKKEEISKCIIILFFFFIFK